MTGVPSEGRLAGIDYGTARIGIAVTDPSRTLASPHANYDRRGPEGDAAYFRQLVAELQLVGWVVGLPTHGSGQESRKSQEVRHFARWLNEVTGLDVVFCDERYTTVQAAQLLGQAAMTRKKRRRRLDMLAAQLILSAYLESAGEQSGADPLGD